MAEGNIIGLLFEISADPKKAQAAIAELRASTVAGAGEVSSLWSSAMSAITGPTGIALGGIVALGGGMLELASKAAETGSRIFEASEKTGIAAEKLSGLMALSKQTGGSFDALSTALARAGVNIEKTIEGGGKLNPLLYQMMGGAQGAAELGLKPMDERIQVLLQRIFQLNDVGQRNTALTALLGRGWQENVSALKLLAEQGYAPAIEKAKQFGMFFDQQAAANARQFQIQMRELSATVQGLALNLGQKLLPFAKEAAVMLSHLGDVAKITALQFERILIIHEAIVTGGATLLVTWKELQNVNAQLAAAQKHQMDGMTQQYLELDKLTKASEYAGQATERLAVGHEHAAKATKEHADAARDLSIVLPPVTVEMQKIEKSRADAVIHAQALALLDLHKTITPLQLTLPQMSADQQKLNQLFSQTPVFVDRTTIAVRAQTGVLHQYFQTIAQGQSNMLAMIHNTGLMSSAMVTFKEYSVEALDQFINAMGHAVAVALTESKSIVQAMEQALKGTLAAIAGEATVRALYNTALGFYYLAIRDYESAALAFKAAAFFGVVAGVAGAASAAIPGGNAGGSGGSGAGSARVAGPSAGGVAGGAAVSGAGTSALAPGASGAQSAQLRGMTQQPVVIHMEFKGPVYGGQQGLDEMARHLNNAVTTRDLKLTASHVVNPAPVSRGRS